MSNIFKTKSKSKKQDETSPNINLDSRAGEVGGTSEISRETSIRRSAKTKFEDLFAHLRLPLSRAPSQTRDAGEKSRTSKHLRHIDNKSSTPSRNQSPDIEDPSEQEINVATHNVSQFQGAHHVTIGDNPRFENNRVKNEYYYGNHGGTHDIPSLKGFVSFKAMHDSSAQDHTRRVHPGTRQYVLKCIKGWINDPSMRERIFWLHGPAGIGKSAIAQTIAHSCTREQLAATFFFFRSDSNRNDGNRLFPTLAWQFAFSNPGTKNALIHSLVERPDIPDKNIEIQFEELIVKPFLASTRSGVQLSAPVVVIDGVDECSDDDLQQRFLKIIGNAVRNDLVPLRFLICSRPEAHIQDAMRIFQSIILPLDLSKLDDANQDIEKYLQAEFARIALEQDLDPTWPGEPIVQTFVTKACGQFVYASTVIKYVGDKFSSAESQLDIVLGLKPPLSVSPFAELDELYIEILRRQRDPAFLKDFLCLLIARDGIGTTDLHKDDAMLMNVFEKELCRKLRGMHSVLKFEPYIDVHHRSFLEFLQDRSRSGQYHIGKQAGMGRYLELIVDSLVRYATAVIEGHDDHQTHFSPHFHSLSSSYPGHIDLPVAGWHKALQPLLELWNKLLTSPNFRSTWKLLPCNQCTGFHTMRDLLLQLAFQLGTSDSVTRSPLVVESHADISDSVTPRTRTETDMNLLERDLNVCLSSLLVRLHKRKFGISVDMDILQLMHSLLHFDRTESVMKLQSISDAQKLMDLIDELINNSNTFSDYGPDISYQAAHLALKIYERVPVLPQSLFLERAVGPQHYIYNSVTTRNLEMLFQIAFVSKILDRTYIVRASQIHEEREKLLLSEANQENEQNGSLRQFLQQSKPSFFTRMRIMLEIAKAIRYFHSICIVLYDNMSSNDIVLDSEIHARFKFCGLIESYVKVTPHSSIGPKWVSYEANVLYFGCLFYEVCFNKELSVVDRIHYKSKISEKVANRPSEPEIRDDEWQLIQRCCAEDPKSCPTMDDIVREMEAWDMT